MNQSSEQEQEIRAVEFIAEIRQVKTLSDHTVNVTLNLPEYCKPQAAWFMQHQGEMVHSLAELEYQEKSRKINEPEQARITNY